MKSMLYEIVGYALFVALGVAGLAVYFDVWVK